MTVKERIFSSVVALTVLSAGTVYSDGALPLEQLSTAQWSQELRNLESTIRDKHLNAFHTMSREDLESAVAELERRIPDLSPAEIVLEFQKVVAMIGDGHSGLRWWAEPAGSLMTVFPLRVQRFSDGIYILNARAPYQHLEGRRIASIDGTPAAEVYAAVAPYVSRDNEITIRAWFRTYFVSADLLAHLGITSDRATAAFGFETADGVEESVSLRPVPMEEYRTWMESLEDPEIPGLRWERPQDHFWFKHLEDENIVYFKFNKVLNQGKRSLTKESRALFDFINENDVEGLIIDVRDNGGGNNNRLRPLLMRMVEHERINRRGRLFIITGRNTFSAAQNFVTRADRDTEALFVGEPAGGKPNHYGDGLQFILPTSGIELHLSSRYWEDAAPGDNRMYVDVDIPAQASYRDYDEGRDAELNAILKYWAENGARETWRRRR